MRKLSTVFSVAAVIATLGLASSAYAAEVLNITNPNDENNGDFRCNTTGETVYWFDAESGPQFGQLGIPRNWREWADDQDEMSALGRTNGYDQDQSNENLARQSCRRFTARYTVDEDTDSLGFANCSVTLNRFGAEILRVRVGITGNPLTTLTPDMTGAGEGMFSTQTWAIPGFVTVANDDHKVRVVGVNPGGADGYWAWPTTANVGIDGSPSPIPAASISVNCEDELVTIGAGAGGGNCFDCVPSKGKSWRYHVAGEVAEDADEGTYGVFHVFYRDTDTGNGEEDFKCTWTPSTVDSEGGNPATATITGTYECDDEAESSGSGTVMITEPDGSGRGKTKDRGTVLVETGGDPDLVDATLDVEIVLESGMTAVSSVLD